MIDLHASTPSKGRKASIMVEELGLDDAGRRADLATGVRHAPDFLKTGPNKSGRRCWNG